MPANTSATGGALFPGPGRFAYDFVLASDPRYWSDAVPQDGVPLEDFLQQLVAGITGLPSQLVRPLWQPEPPALPPFGTDWMATGVVANDLDPGWAWEWYGGATDQLPTDAAGNPLGLMMQQHETFDLLCVAYGEHADWYDGLIRDGFQLGQNNALLQLTSMALVRVGARAFVPELIQGRWWRRIDRRITLHREIRRLYPILNILTGSGEILRDV